MIEINKIYNENCLDTMKRMEDNFIDLVVSSPPYSSNLTSKIFPEFKKANMREYKGYEFDFESIAKELYRVLKDGAVIMWNIGDVVYNGSESGESFRQALYFMDLGFKLHDTMLYYIMSPFKNKNRYMQVFEYCFVLSKNKPPKAFNIICDRPNKYAGNYFMHNERNRKTGEMEYRDYTNKKPNIIQPYGARTNIWKSHTTKENDHDHPAIMPYTLARDHIISWSNENDIVYDPFGGSMTTVIASIKTNRKWIASEISKEYYEKHNTRVLEIFKDVEKENRIYNKRKTLLNSFLNVR